LDYFQIEPGGSLRRDGGILADVPRVSPMKDYIQAHIQRSESGYRAECFDLPILTEGQSLDEAVENLQTAIHDFLEGKDLARLGLAPKPKVMVSFHFGPYAFADM
jgi:predicted RNase H-like HicB family nuclease